MTNESKPSEEVIVDANANPQGIAEDATVANAEEVVPREVTPEVDYKTKFSESAKEAQRLYAENQELKSVSRQTEPQPEVADSMDSLYPGFENLGEDEQRNLVDYTNEITKRAKAEIYKDPAIAFAKASYNTKVWDDAFANVSAKYPELMASKDEFKSKYFHVNNVPSNIESILEDVAKMHLFDQAKSIGAKEESEKLSRMETERATGGDREPVSNRTLEDWARMGQENPAKFAKLSREYQKDLDSGKI